MNHHSKQDKLSERLLKPGFERDDRLTERYQSACQIAEHYASAENAVAVLSWLVCDKSYICHGRLGRHLGIGEGSKEVESIWEKEILDRIHPNDVAEKIAWELRFLSFIEQVGRDCRRDYYLQHYLRIKDASGIYHTLRHRIFYLDYDNEGNVTLALCLYTAQGEQPGRAGIYCSLDDTRVREIDVCAKGLLSDRECEILSQISQGLASKQIADMLYISTNTVNNHRQNIMRKLHCRNTTEAVGVARRLGMIC